MEQHLQRFIQRVKDGESSISSEYDIIKKQNNNMKKKFGLTTEDGGTKDNAKKNRYKDILPYDQSRVRLKPTTPEHDSDYINANFIMGAIENKKYIATQGPLLNTLVDFWRMIWQYDVRVVIMACKVIEMGKKKCDVYWASLTETTTFGPFIVSTVEESPLNEEVMVRTLAVNYCDETRTVSQYQYLTWPDHGIPDLPDGILEMMKLANGIQDPHSGPMLIHCSAGCGRTGVICAIDYVNDLLNKKKICEDFSIMDIVLDLRRQRPSAVQTKEQYTFVFHTVVQMFQKVLQDPANNSQHQSKNLDSLYSNVLYPKPAVRSVSVGSKNFDQQTRPPPLRPRSSHPPASSRMNDTYAVVNKTKPPASSALHHYDNEITKPKTELYSSVKPKTRPTSNTTTTPIYSRPLPVSQRVPGVPLKTDDGYEPMPDFRPKESQPHSLLAQRPTERDSSSEDDYEYVPAPVKDNQSNYCSPGGIGFNHRVKKPKGPRDPPAQWNRPER